MTTFADSSSGTGKALGVSQTTANLLAGTISGVTITGSTLSGNSQSGGSLINQTLLTTTTASTVGFFGVTAIAQPANAAQAALTAVTGTSGGFAFSTSTAFSAMIAQLENIRASLVLLGLVKGGA